MIITENIWLDDDTFIVDGVRMNKQQISNLTRSPARVCMSTNNKELLTEISIIRRESKLNLLKIFLEK